MAVRNDNRFKSASSACPICGGWATMQRGAGKRCFGFLSEDGKFAHCSREEYAGGLLLDGASTYSHYLNGPCKCGVIHREEAPVIDFTTRRDPDVTYPYRNEKEVLLYQVCRFNEPNGAKTFRQRRPDGRGGWIWKLEDTRRVPYRLPELLAADPKAPVFIVEGEKDADNLAKLGYVATCNSEGAGKWHPEFGPLFQGRDVVIIPDNDEPGQKHAGMVLASVYQAARTAKILNLEGLPSKGDVTDWLAQGHTGEELMQLALRSPISRPTLTPTGRPRPTIISAKDLAAKDFAPLEYIIAGILPVGATLLAAKPKIGKSWLAMGIGVATAAGGVALNQPVKKGEALYLALEDNLPRLKRRLLKVCPYGIPDGLEFATDWARSDQGGLEDLETYIQEHPKLKFVTIDTLQKWRKPATGRDNIYNADYEALEGLTRLAGKYGIAILIVTHTRKGTSEDPLEEVSGSNGLTGAVDNALILRRDRGQADAVMHRIGRDLEDDSPLALKFDAMTATWTVIGSAEEHASTRERQEIVDLLKQHPAGLSPNDIALALNKNRVTTQTLVQRLVEEGKLKQDGFRGKYKSVNSVNSVNFNNSVNSINFNSKEEKSEFTEAGLQGHVNEVAEVYEVYDVYSIPPGLGYLGEKLANRVIDAQTPEDIDLLIETARFDILDSEAHKKFKHFAERCKNRLK